METPVRPRTAVVADASRATRRVLTRLLRDEFGWTVLVETGDGLEALGAVRRLNPDVLFVADNLEIIGGREVRRALAGGVDTLVMSMTDDPRTLSGPAPAVLKNAGSKRIHDVALAAWAARGPRSTHARSVPNKQP